VTTGLSGFFAGLAVSAALVPVIKWIALRTGVVAHPRNDRWHRTTVPLLGGVSIALATLAGTLLMGQAAEVSVPLAAAMAVFVAGLVDDLLALKPATKLIIQIALSAAVVYSGYQLYWVESRLLDSLLTMVWLVGLTNAFNLLDNMDGLCAGTALIVAVMLIAGLLLGEARAVATPEILFLSVVAGAVTGFLIYNFPPASIFMGDSGSLMLGFILATLTLNNDGVRGSRADLLSAISGPVFVLLLPIFDTTLVTVLRLLAGRSPAVGGRDHSSHRLVGLGLSERSAVFVLWSLAAIGGGVGLLLRSASGGSLLAGGMFLAAICLLAYRLARVRVYDEASPVTAAVTPPAVTPLTVTFMYKRRVLDVGLDFILIGAAYYVANRLRFGQEAYLANAENFYTSLPIVLATQLMAFFAVGVYRGTWDHFQRKDRVTFVKGVALGAAGGQLLILALYRYYSYSISVFLIYAVLLAMLMILSRSVMRLLEDRS